MSLLGNRTYELSLTRDYVSGWGMVEAVRELIQNAIDSPSPFVYEFTSEDDGSTTLRLQSEQSTLSPQTLLLGRTTKAEDDGAIGSFGEGYKIALLVLTRLGYRVVLHNGAVDWAPAFRVSRTFDMEVLAIRETTAARKSSGLNVMIYGLSQQDVAAIVDSCLMMQNNIGQVKTTTKGDILLERPGRLYVGGLFICETETHYGYNVKPSHIRLERDRRTVSTFDLFDVTRDMWYETKEFDHIAKMIDQQVPDMRYAEFSAPDMVREACYQLFRQQNPGAVVAASQTELKQLVSQGMTKVVVVNSGMYSAVSRAPSYVREPRVRILAPRERLQGFLATYRFNMHDKVRRAFVDLIEESKSWRL